MKIISFANQKGGSGKTNTTRAVATWLHYSTDLRIILVDLDFQQSCMEERAKDERALIEMRESTPGAHKLLLYDAFKETKEMYPVIGIRNIANNLAEFKALYEREKENFDLMFIDVPGNMSDGSIDAIVDYLNYLFIPTDIDYGSVKSSATFGTIINGLKQDGSLPNLETIKYFFNKITLTKNKSVFQPVAEFISESTGIEFLPENLKDTNEMKMESSTLWPIKGSDSDTHYLNKFSTAILKEIKL